MKVLLINGSPKGNGNTFQALSEVARTLNAEDIETEIVSIGKQAVQGCVACGWGAGWVNAHIMTTCITKYGGR